MKRPSGKAKAGARAKAQGKPRGKAAGAQAKPQPGAQAQAGPQSTPFDLLLSRAKALAAGDDIGLKQLVADLLQAKFTSERAEPLLRAASKATGIGLKTVKDLLARARAELRRREEATPAAQQAALMVQEAQAKAARAERDAEVARLWVSCKDLAQDESVLTKMAEASQRAGMVGEKQAIRAVCLSMVSRLLKDGGVNLVRRGAPAGGKNFLVSIVTTLMPPESVIALSASSPTALIYFGDDENALKHKLIIIAEAAAIAAKANGEEHPLTILLRTLLSEGHIDRLVTIPQPNGLPKSVHVRRNGPVVVILTSARDDIDEELFTRLMACDVDEGNEQTKAIVARKLGQGDKLDPLAAGEVERWRDLQRWLEIDAPYEVEIPFLKALHETWLALIDERPAALQLRIRRDISGMLAAVKASAVLHKAKRGKAGDKIIAEIADYEHAWEAFHPGLSALYGMQIRPEIIAVVRAAESLGVPLYDGVENPPTPPSEPSVKLTAAMLCRATGINSKKTAINRVQEAIERGVLKEDDARRGRGRGSPRYFWLLQKSGDLETPSKQQIEAAVFPSPAEVKKKWKGGTPFGEQEQEEQEEQDARPAPDIHVSCSSCSRNSAPSPSLTDFSSPEATIPRSAAENQREPAISDNKTDARARGDGVATSKKAAKTPSATVDGETAVKAARADGAIVTLGVGDVIDIEWRAERDAFVEEALYANYDDVVAFLRWEAETGHGSH